MNPKVRLFLTAILLTLAARGSGAQGAAPTGKTIQGESLRIIVLEGEKGVNVISQRTAVRPIVEVRGRNDLPVSGAAVTFLIGSRSRTAAGGARQVTIITDATGRAAMPDVVPTATGPLDIQVRATYQGQTASATVHQIDVATLAQAEAAVASGASAATGTAVAAGGLSTLALAEIIGGAAAGAGSVAVAVSGSDDGPGNGGSSGGTGGSSSNHQPVIAALTASSSVGVVAGMPIQFSVSASDADSDPLTVQWNFGDGTTATGSTVAHSYVSGGQLRVTATVFDGLTSAVAATDVSIVDITGAWTVSGPVGFIPTKFNLVQTGNSIAGTATILPYSTITGSAMVAVTGSVNPQTNEVILNTSASTGPAFQVISPVSGFVTHLDSCADTYSLQPAPAGGNTNKPKLTGIVQGPRGSLMCLPSSPVALDVIRQ